jgi:hypothetical protein
VTIPGPAVVSAKFVNQATQSVVVQFNEPINAVSISASDLSVQSTAAGGSTFAPSAVTFNPSTYTATFTFPARLPSNSGYTATLAAASVNDGSGESLATAYSFTFYDLLGDTNGDGRVNVADLANLAGNFGTSSGATWSKGDFDYNGNVNVPDLADLAGNFGVDLTSGGSPATSAQVAAALPAASASQMTTLSIAGPDNSTASELSWRRHRSAWSELPIN